MFKTAGQLVKMHEEHGYNPISVTKNVRNIETYGKFSVDWNS
jgi:hypothetical protein